MTAAELIEHYAKVRRRLYGKPKSPSRAPAVRAKPEPVTCPEPSPRVVKIRKPPDHDKGPRWAMWLASRIAMYHGVNFDVMMSKTRVQKYVEARHAACYWIHRRTGWSLPRVGDVLNREHTSVLNAIRRHEATRAKKNQKRMEKINVGQ